jgi:hypothetical protein
MLGYSESKIAAKAAKRGQSVEDYKKYLVTKRQTRSARRAEARKARAAAEVKA